ncbi:MAG: L-fucose/L-arabinose isomerase family protein [Clostridiales bacterium]|nr:L-fucose/L-arabinose isomerase family protein [Clostridiales bacterium]
MFDNKYSIKLGYAPTRRNVFSREDAIKYKNLVRDKIKQMGIEYIDLEWLNEDGLLYSAKDVDTVAERFRSEGVDAVFCPHCNFGTEDAVAKLAKKMNKPFLLWGPRDESPLEDGTRLRDSQCGLFATSKVLRRLGIPFTYIENCRVEDAVFEEGIRNFILAASVVKNFRNMRIGQIDTRPQGFWTVMCNEGELLERFGIEIVPTTITEVVGSMNTLLKNNDKRIESDVADFQQRFICRQFSDEVLFKMAALKYAIKDWAEEEELSAVAIQCWNALQDATGLMPCFVNSELTGEGLPVICETDICGAVTAVMTQAAMMGKTPIFFADLTIRHPENDNAELLWHCGPFPYKLKKEGAEAKIGEHYILDGKCPGVAEWEIKGGDITICRFDGDNGKYSFLTATGRGVEGPKNRGTYVWIEFKDWPSLEKKIINGPYIHHVAGIHGKIMPIMIEALKYIPGIEPDMVE